MAHNVAARDRRGQSLSELPEQALRALLLALSRRRSLGRLATGTSLTRPMVRRFVAGQTLDEALDVVADLFEFQMLFGVRRDLQEQLLADGRRVRVYVPFGADWYPYFMRRRAERPANVAFMLKALVRERGGSGTTPRAGTAGKA